MVHWDVRREYSRDVGRALAGAMDRNIAQIALLTARATGNITGAPNGTKVETASVSTNADALVASIFSAAQALDEKDVPKEDRYLFLKPAQYYLLINSGSRAVHADFNTGGSNGGVGVGRIYQVAGIPIVMTNNLPSTNITTGPTAYQGDFTKSVALVMHRSAVGTVKLMDLAVEMDYDIRRQGTLIVGKYACGHGILRPECAVEIALPAA